MQVSIPGSLIQMTSLYRSIALLLMTKTAAVTFSHGLYVRPISDQQLAPLQLMQYCISRCTSALTFEHGCTAVPQAGWLIVLDDVDVASIHFPYITSHISAIVELAGPPSTIAQHTHKLKQYVSR
eukprot:GHUV01024237.1.p2 GENE.GHUV01024237.1~~GHUV01024237.1.p2  ORF type:complete len:125 (-),score=18.23 GHUV01024237.1:372-746(-)